MLNTKKAAQSMSPKLRANQYLLLFHICYYLRHFTDLEQIFEIRKLYFG